MTLVEASVHADVGEIDPREWDGLLAADDLQASHRFARVCRDARIEDAVLRHVVVRRRGRIAATASLTRMTVSIDLLSPGPLRGIADAVRQARPRFLRLPFVFCGLPVSFGASSLRFAADADVDAALGAVARAMEEFAEESGATLLCFKEFTGAESSRLGALGPLGYFAAPSLPGCALRAPWGDFAGYVGAMRAGYRRQVRGSLAARERVPLELTRAEDFAAECPRIHALYEQVMDRAEHQLERLPLGFFERLAAEMGPDASALLLRHEGRLEAAAVLLHSGRTLTFLIAGIDYSHHRADLAYPNLVLEVVAEAIRRGATRVELGQTSYALKTRLGGVPEPRWIHLRHRGARRHGLLRAAAPVLFPETRVPARRVFAREVPVG